LIIPRENEEEAALVKGPDIYAARTLAEVVAFLNGEGRLPKISSRGAEPSREALKYPFDFREVKGQFQAKRAIEVAVSGSHNLLLIGPPGSGKTMLARRIPSILPELTPEEAIEVTKIYSVAGMISNGSPLLLKRPFRSPHHSVSAAGLAGGGSFPRPGEVSLAHYGVLFLDELPEFRRDALEILRGPLEDRELTVARAKASIRFPAQFMLAAAMNPCPCGFLGDPKRACRCHPARIATYRSKISGPLLDRIDIQIEVPSVSYGHLVRDGSSESSEAIRHRVQKVRTAQQVRFRDKSYRTNSEIDEKDIHQYGEPAASAGKLLERAMTELSFSARAYTRILKVSRTIADMAESESVREEHIAEAIQYRVLDRQLF
jgi:magnesium chelatase family protein